MYTSKRENFQLLRGDAVCSGRNFTF